MANNEHLEVLKQGIKEWNNWRASNPEIRPDLSKADLSQILTESFFHSGSLGIRIYSTPDRSLNFSNTILRKADLSGVVFFGGDLRRADLKGAKLSKVSLAHVSLREANLRAAKLFDADLPYTDLTRANLGYAVLFGANLRGTKLSEADFTRARVGSTLFSDTDLSGVKGLDNVYHGGRSIISIDTIYRSKGSIPDTFLRGCGVPENFITHMRSLVEGAQPIEFYSCFISYSHADKSFARRLHAELQARGIRCWLDEHQVLPGQKIYTEVDRGIRLWDKVLLCCSKESLKSWWVDNEIKIAFDKEQHLWKERGQEVQALIPLNLDDYLFSGKWTSGMATEVKSRLAADFTGWEADNSKFETEFERLVRALRADAGGRELPPRPRL